MEAPKTAKNNFFLKEEVKKSVKNPILKARLRVLILSKGLSEADFYHSIGLTKVTWYRYSWGIEEIPRDVKIRIAQSLGSDTAAIFEEAKE